MLKRIGVLYLLIPFLFAACEKEHDRENSPVTYGDTFLSIDISTDKALYNPGERVTFTLEEKPAGTLLVRYYHLGILLKEEPVSGTQWSWTPPVDDYKGYMAALYETKNGQEQLLQTIAVDVSSDWRRFPRYGFLSSYGPLTETQIEQQIALLSRYRINGLQFYDWQHDHHRPLAGTVDNPLESWPDLIGRTNYLSTVKGYIEAAHKKGMMTMFYNLAFGALKNASSDGVAEAWYLFRDPNHSVKDSHPLDPPFRSSIWLTNPGNSAWQTYLADRNDDVYSVFDFDGYHIDQLGNRGTLYDYDGNVVNLAAGYAPFIAAMKKAQPGKRLVMNAVSSYGQEQIAQSETEFFYTEVWNESNSFAELARVITDNDSRSGGAKRTVLAAYMNYGKSNTIGYLNVPGVLLANAVIFSFGGAHLELGEHYLANEYFPNNNLQMKSALKKSLLHYYDFMTAYQNLLRDGGETAHFDISAVDDKLNVQQWPASQGSVAVTGKSFPDRDVLHLINFTHANSMEWRDNNGTQKEPAEIADAVLTVKNQKSVKKVWFASPDQQGGVATSLPFTQQGDEISFTLPRLKYWDMVVLEYK